MTTCLEVGKYQEWTYNEENYLRENHKNMTINEMAKELDRDYTSVRNKLSHIGIKAKRQKRKLGDYALYKDDELISMGTIKEIHKETGMRESTLYTYACRGTVGRVTVIRLED